MLGAFICIKYFKKNSAVSLGVETKERFGARKELTEKYKVVPVGNRTVRLDFCFVLFYSLVSMWSKPYLFESREEETYREREWRGCDRREVTAMVNIEKVKF